MESPMPLYEYMVLAKSLEAARTVMRFPLFNSNKRHCIASQTFGICTELAKLKRLGTVTADFHQVAQTISMTTSPRHALGFVTPEPFAMLQE